MSARALVVAWKELHQLRRDRLTLAMMLVLPILQLLLFGYAINTDVRHIHTVVLDDDRSAASRDLVRRLEATGFYDVVGNVERYDDVDRAFRSGQARVAVVIPARRRRGSRSTSSRQPECGLGRASTTPLRCPSTLPGDSRQSNKRPSSVCVLSRQ